MIKLAKGPAVDLQGVSKRFGVVVVLDGISLVLAQGQRHGIEGPNGSGKTTLLRMLAGLVLPDSGAAFCLGFDLRSTRSGLRQELAYVTQQFSLYGELTVRENMAFVAALRAVPSASQAIETVLADFDLMQVADTRAQHLSGGGRQRLMLAAALVHTPKLLLLDEPTAALDAAARDAFWGKLDEQRHIIPTVIVTSHLESDAAHCDTITELQAGRIISHRKRGI
jgi:ABC-type multidrug transport system ATPase subunit